MIRLEHMQEFVALAERLSFTDASAELYVAQPSLSRHVAGMEAELGVKLLNRSTRQVQLTPAGETMYAAFNRILRVYRDAADLARVYGAGWEGRLRIGSPRFLAEEFMEDRALEFTRRYPEVKLELRTFQPERSQAAVLDGEIDLTVCLHTDLPERGLCFLPFDREPLNAVLSADHPLAGEAQLSLSQLSRERFIFLAGEDGCSPRHFERFLSPLLEERGVKPDQILHLARFDDFGITIRQTGAVSILLRRTGNIGRERLCSLPLTDPECSIPLCFCWREGDKNPAIPAFCGLAEDEPAHTPQEITS